MDDGDDKSKTNGTDDGYRKRADGELRKNVAALAESLGIDVSELGDDFVPDSETASTISPAPSYPDASERLVSLGMTEAQAQTIAHRFGDVLNDEAANGALAKTVEFTKSTRDGSKNIHAGHRQRLRESVLRDAELNGFSDVEILETLLSFAVPQRDTNGIAHELLQKFGSLLSVIRTPAEELAAIKGMTARAARLIPMLSTVCLWDVRSDIAIKSQADAVDFFGAIYLGGRSVGMNVAYLDETFTLIAVEKATGTHTEKARAIVGSAYKYSAKYVIAAYCSFDMFPEKYNVAEFAEVLRQTLATVDARLIDCMVFGAAGYYSLGASAFDGGEVRFEYVPLIAATGYPELVDRLISVRKSKIRPVDGDDDF